MEEIVTVDEIEQYAKRQISKSRFKHTLGVAKTAGELAVIYNEDIDKAMIAALLHDIAKEFSSSKKKDFCQEYHISLDEYLKRNIHLTHGEIAAHIAKRQCNIKDQDILNAIANHTLGRRNMSNLEKIIYLADIIEPNRRPRAGLGKLRRLAYTNLEDAMKDALKSNVAYLNAKNKEVHPIIYTILEEYEDFAHMEGINEGI